MGLPAKSPQAILWGPRVGGGTTFPAGRTLYFTFEHTSPAGKGGQTIFPCRAEHKRKRADARFFVLLSVGSVSCFVGMGTEATYRGDGVEGGEVFRVEGEGEDVGVLDYAGGRGGFWQGKDAVF